MMRRSAVLAVFGLLLAWASAASAQGVHVALTPSSSSVSPGTEFDVFVDVTQAGSSFNAFDAVVQYDPGALTLLTLSPISQQEGSLMTTACADRFHDFRPGADRDTITDVLFCNGVSVSGPGRIYRLHFRAASTPQATTVRFLRAPRFYDGGLLVGPVTASDATIGIGVTLGVGDPGPLAAGLHIRAFPNPARGASWFRIESDRAGEQQLRVLDLSGRLVRRLERGYFEPGARTLLWDGRADSGARLPPGSYRVQVRSGATITETRLSLIE